MPEQKLCPACGHMMAERSEWRQLCPSCGYEASNLQSGPGAAFVSLERLRKDNFELLLDGIERLKPLKGARILEIGCSKGWFLESAAARQARVLGVEPVEADAVVARQKGFQVEQGLFPDSPADKGPYDIIIFNDVFEHIPQPEEAIKAVESLLAPGGLAVINLPNSKGFFYRLSKMLASVGATGPFDRMWQKGMPSPHMSYFSPSNLKSLVERHTELRQVAAMSLPTVSRHGLYERVASQSLGGIPASVVFPFIWLTSFLLPVLPPDIHAGIFACKK